MSGREWRPGDVALVDSWRGVGQVAFRCERVKGEPTWCVLDGTDSRGLDDEEISRAQRVALIAYEDRESVERLATLFNNVQVEANHRAIWWTDMQAALREFADPKPPKPEEPTGLGAVVEDESGAMWVRSGKSYTDPNWRVTGGDEWTRYDAIPAVRILSHGYDPEATS